MQYKCKVTVIDKKCFSDYQEKYLADPKSGACPFYEIGDTTLFERYGGEDTFWTQANGAHCSEAWDCISRYIYTALQGGSIMRGWTNDEHIMIACCNDGTRPVIFKIERLDYSVVKINGITLENSYKIKSSLEKIPMVNSVEVLIDKGWVEVFQNRNAPVSENLIKDTVQQLNLQVSSID